MHCDTEFDELKDFILKNNPELNYLPEADKIEAINEIAKEYILGKRG